MTLTMIKLTGHYFKLLILLLSSLIHRLEKCIKFFLSGKHELERIIELTNSDIYEKSMRVDQWLHRTHNKSIKKAFNQQFEDRTANSSIQKGIRRVLNKFGASSNNNNGDHNARRSTKNKICDRAGDSNDGTILSSNLEHYDLILSSTLKDSVDKFLRIIVKEKHMQKLSAQDKECLSDILYRVLSYKLSIFWAEQLAAMKYDSDLDDHTNRLMNLWNNLIKADSQARKNSRFGPNDDGKVFPSELSYSINTKEDIISNRWSHIGFQGEDPGTDFRGMGMLGLVQLEYLSEKPNRLARDLLKRSLNERYSYPFAIVGINITYNLLKLFQDGSMKHLYYDTGDILFRGKQHRLNLISIFNDLYVELFLRFDCFWHESKPETIFQFKELMEEFVNVVRKDLSNRNFSLKFIY